MKTKAADTALYSIRIFLMVFWLYVALDKLWNLPAFHRALLRQPFPDWWADILYWALPLAELGIALLFVLHQPKKRVISTRDEETSAGSRKARSAFFIWHSYLPFLLSAILLLIFTIYIGLGVAGFYAERPCGCASVFSGLSWDWHLLANTVLLGLSILGRFLCGSSVPTDYGRAGNTPACGRQPMSVVIAVPIYVVTVFIRRRFPRRFALFPGRPVGR